MLTAQANEEDLKKQYRAYSLLLHPDRCKDPRAKDAFHVIEQAHKTLMDPEKKKVYLRVMREAKERATFERERENKKREKNEQVVNKINMCCVPHRRRKCIDDHSEKY